MNGLRNCVSVKSSFFAACATSIMLATPAQSANTHVSIRQGTKSDGINVDLPRIIVDGPTASGYDEVTNGFLDIWTMVNIKIFGATRFFSVVTVTAESKSIFGTIVPYQSHKIRFVYVDPRSSSAPELKIRPVGICNSRLASLNGPARTAFLNDGAEIKAVGAYQLKVSGIYEEQGGSHGVENVVAKADAVIVCLPLIRPGRVTPAVPAALLPDIAAAELRIEPQKISQIGKQLCPTQLRLYGRVEARRAFQGKAVIFGTGFLSPVTNLSYGGPGNRNIVATYPLSWAAIGGLAGSAPSGLRSQTISLTMNVTNLDNKVLESVKETVTVTCKPMRVSGGTAIGGAIGGKAGGDNEESVSADPQMWSWHEAVRTNAPAAARMRSRGGPITFRKNIDAGTPSVLPAIDVHIRKVDRGGPGGATRLWLRNGGTQKAENCELAVRRESDQGWILIESVSLAPGETREVTAAMPRDPGLEFAVTCPGEAAALLANNVARLP